MTVGSFFLGFVYYALAFLCLRVIAAKKKSAGTLLAAVRSLVQAVLKRPRDLPELARAALPWLGLAVFLVLFGFARQLNLQILITEHAQSTAYVEGWYGERSTEQLRFVVIVIVIGVVLTFLLGILLRKRLADVGIPVAASVFLVTLLLVRTASHHAVDALLHTPILFVRAAHVLEAAALLAIGVSARLAGRPTREPEAPIVARIDRGPS